MRLTKLWPATPITAMCLLLWCLEATAKKLWSHVQDVIEVTGDGLKPVQSGLNDKAAPKYQNPPGASHTNLKGAKLEITQLPEVEGRLSLWTPHSGAIKALVGVRLR